MSAEPEFQSLTAREALLEIRRLIATGRFAIADLDSAARQGLDHTGMVNFETTDQLADRLAEAHAELRRIKDDGFPNGPRDAAHIDGILALPPDLEAMVDRRIGPS